MLTGIFPVSTSRCYLGLVSQLHSGTRAQQKRGHDMMHICAADSDALMSGGSNVL